MRDLRRPIAALPLRVTSVIGIVLAIAGAALVSGPDGLGKTDRRLAMASGTMTTVYAVTNLDLTDPTYVEEVFSDSSGFSYAFTETLPPGGTSTHHLLDLSPIPSPFDGSLTVLSDHPVSAAIVGYDNPGTPSPGPTRSQTATSTPTGSVHPFVPPIGTRTYLPLVGR